MRPAPFAESFMSLMERRHSVGGDCMSSPHNGPIRMPSSEGLNRLSMLASQVAGRSARRVAVAGGVAMNRYGSPRLTKNVDVISDGAPGPAPELTRKAPLSFGGIAFETEAGIDLDWIVEAEGLRGLDVSPRPTRRGGYGSGEVARAPPPRRPVCVRPVCRGDRRGPLEA